MKHIKLFGLLAVSVLAGCTWFQPDVTVTRTTVTPLTDDTNTTVTTTTYRDATADQLSLALLTPTDVTAYVSDVNPLPLEFNGQLDTYLQDYDFYLARQWNDAEGNKIIGNAITRYTSAEAAQANVADLAAECDEETDQVIGDVTYVCYVEPLLYYGGPSDPGYMTYRFVLGQYGVRVDLIDTGDVFDDNSVIYDRLKPMLYRLALAQADRLQDVLDDETLALVDTPAVGELPEAPDGTALLGSSAVTVEEWMALTGDESSELTGFASGAIRRFLLDERPEEVLEVIVMEFATAEQAEALLADFEAPTEGIAETQKTQDNFFFDISIFSPFGEMDYAAASVDLTTYATLIAE
ncbi:MAG: hypothetical protein ACD_41C00057G0002 [uncultured bacterium]|nr:MAG: hypothetical protein ACD_41C00057G0002 [uncultured bacterium]